MAFRYEFPYSFRVLEFDESHVKIEENQYIQAHTILKTVAHEYAKKPVLILGGHLDTLRKVAQEYVQSTYTLSSRMGVDTQQ